MGIKFIRVVMGIFVRFMVVLMFPLQKRHALGGIDQNRNVGKRICPKLLQSGTGENDRIRSFQHTHVRHLQGIVMQAADTFRNQTGDGQIRALTQTLRKFINGKGCSCKLGRCLILTPGQQKQQKNQKKKEALFHIHHPNLNIF